MAEWKLPNAPQRATNKVDMPNSVIDLYGTPIFQWYVEFIITNSQKVVYNVIIALVKYDNSSVESEGPGEF